MTGPGHLNISNGPWSPHRWGRGASYVLMVLLAAVGATVVGATVSLAAARSYSERVERDVTEAQAHADAGLVRVRQTLHVDPHRPLRQVLPFERPRVCLPDGSTHDPGQGWDLARCGAVWDYRYEPGLPSETDDATAARVELRYDLDASNWEVRSLGDNGSVLAGFRARMSRSTGAETTAVSNADLSFADLFRAANNAPSGALAIYSTGTITLPNHDTGTPATSPATNAPELTPTDLVLADPSDGAPAFVGAPGTTAADLYGPASSGAPTGPWRDVRDTVSAPLTLGAAQADLPAVREFGCPSGSVPSNYPDDPLTTYLCPEPGRTVRSISGDAVTIPAATTAIALETVQAEHGLGPDVADAPAYRVHWSSKTPQGIDCVTACDLTARGRGAVEAGLHPGDRSFWDGHVDVWWPSTGVVATSVDLYVGICGSQNFLQPFSLTDPTEAASCDEDPANGLSTRFRRPATLLAGTPERPADIYIGAPLRTIDSTVNVGLLATNDLQLAWWARPPGGRLDVHAAAMAFGLGDAVPRNGFPSAIRTAPAQVCVPADDTARCQNNTASALNWTGSLAAAHLRLVSNQYERVTITGNPDLTDHAPPLYPSYSDAGWRTLARTPMSWSSADLLDGNGDPVCSDPRCPAW